MRSPNHAPLLPSPSTSTSSLLGPRPLIIWSCASSTRALQVFMDMTPVYGLIFLFKWTQVNPLCLFPLYLHLSPSLPLIPSISFSPASPSLAYPQPQPPRLTSSTPVSKLTSSISPPTTPLPLSIATHTFDPRPDWNSFTVPRPKS